MTRQSSTQVHPLELRSVAGYAKRVHATAFARAVETIMSFDSVGQSEAVGRFMSELDAGALRLVVAAGHASYQVHEAASPLSGDGE